MSEPSVRLNKSIASEIGRKIISHRFSADYIDLFQQENQLFWAAYEDRYSPEDITMMNALPEGWLPTTNQLSVKVGGMQYRLKRFTKEEKNRSIFIRSRHFDALDFSGFRVDVSKFSTHRKSRIRDCDKGRDTQFSQSTHFGIAIDRLFQLKEQKDEEVRQAMLQISSKINPRSTSGALKKLWPEISTFVDDCVGHLVARDVAAKAGSKQALQLVDLNKTLHLPPK